MTDTGPKPFIAISLDRNDEGQTMLERIQVVDDAGTVYADLTEAEAIERLTREPGVTFHVVCPVCRQTLTYQHREADAWGSLSPDDTAIAQVTTHDRGVLSDHLKAHREDGTLAAAMENLWAYQARRHAAYVERRAKAEEGQA
jgi:uncharacterized protein YbaR (Trm112 family)